MTEKEAIKMKLGDKNSEIDNPATAGHGSQVVRILEDHSYELDDDELKKIMLKEEYKDLPVVVVSVAGTYRGGKSFLLNILLRYLTSPPSAQQDGSWLAEDSKPLTGFSWRGGSVRNTTGILLWSVPIVLSLPSGEKVAVVLMDTQGTFDNQSTIRDCSTIFGLSTLLSSVQIYNLSKNIKEDDMQHLQLFTEYGKLARETGTMKPFQSLIFLVRDWPYPWEYAYGAEGGNLLLQSKVEVDEKTPQEIKTLREHLQASFEKISGFLLPHPGFNVLNPKFNGTVKELNPDFRTHLIELAASLFSPDKLMIKCMNEEKIKLGHLYTYFKTYLTLFNSDDVPDPTNIMQATITAVLLNSTNEARDKYIKGMDAECGATQPSLPDTDLKQLHRKYITTAREYFLAKKKMGSAEEAKKYLEDLIKDLDARLPKIQMNNSAKLEATLKKAMFAYDQCIQKVNKGKPLCLHPQDFLELHKEGVKTAMSIFDSSRRVITSKEDLERFELAKDLKKIFSTLEQSNDINNKTAVTEICSQYSRVMENNCSLEPPLREDAFKREHENAMKLALNNFNNKRNRSHQYPEDIHKKHLVAEINSVFTQLNKINISKYIAMAVAMMRQASNKARQLYEKKMHMEFGEKQQSMPNEDVEYLHRKHLEEAKLTFTTSITMGTKEESNEFLQILIQELEGQLPHYQLINMSKLQTTINKTKDAYQATFSKLSKNEPLCLHPLDLEKTHKEGINIAIKLFESNRKVISSKTDDEKSKIEQDLKKIYEKLQLTNDRNSKNLVSELHTQYSQIMNTKCSIEPPLREDAFKHEHEIALKTALDNFSTRRNKTNAYPDDTHKTSLVTEISATFSLLNNINTSKYKSMVLAEIAQATDKSRQFYDTSMMADCGTGQTSMPAKDLEVLHKKYLEKAKEIYTANIHLATQNEASKHLKEIIQELDGRFLMFEQYNTSKYETNMKNAIDKYEDTIQNTSNNKPICVHPTDLQKMHDESVSAAMKIYNANRKLISDRIYEKKSHLDMLFEKRLVMLNAINDQNNRTMLKEIHTDYWKKMKIHCAHSPPYSDEDFKNRHESALKNALEVFDSKRNKPNSYSQDIYKEELLKIITNSYKVFININSGNRQEKENIKEEQKRLREENVILKNQQEMTRALENRLNQLRTYIREFKMETKYMVQRLRAQLNGQKSIHQRQLDDMRNRNKIYLIHQNNQITRLRNIIHNLASRIGYY